MLSLPCGERQSQLAPAVNNASKTGYRSVKQAVAISKGVNPDTVFEFNDAPRLMSSLTTGTCLD